MTRPADPHHAGRPTTTGAAPRHPAHGVRRLVRVAALGGSSLVLAGTAHLLGGGRLPSPGVLVVLTLLVGLVAVTATARRVRLPLLVALLGAEQLALHVVLGATAVPATAAGCLAGPHAHHAAVTGCLPPGAVPSPGAPAADTAMWAGHAVAVLATAWLLARGEATLWRAVDRVARAVPVLTVRAGTRRVPLPAPAPATAALRRPHTPAAPRGPPLLA
ncbi:hypothetical protein SAMN04488543_3004 [Friedmanniella luteola]|uniref:Uncharacterized protein n=1 Tax=Friedmanniella luteola TaxID=546871 RepID=A0A1H1XID1_9ACTN|nr:hypothetical protein [Friedmanniella luteola]SDT08861.1 hypothetical protein SAMN04488543_3004 [Friedmanniella luteola]